MCLALLCAGLMAALPGPDAPTAEVAQAYREERARAGRSSADQVKLALWCEAHGLTRERLNHLAQAVLSDPANATARGLMGLVAYEGRFLRPEAVAEKAGADAELAARLADYRARRARTPASAEAQWKLALWCEENRMEPEARAHLTAVVRLDPSRDLAWKRLGFRKHGGRWLEDAAIAAEKSEAEAQKRADRRWKPILAKIRADLQDKDKRAAARAALDDLTDPRAVRSVCSTFASGGDADQAIAVRVLGQVDSAEASRALATLAVFAQSPEARREATETLRRRDPREFAELLIALLSEEVKYEVRPVAGPGSPGALFVQGRRFNVQKLYSPPPVPEHLLYLANWAELDEYGMPVIRFWSNTSKVSETRAVAVENYSFRQFMNLRPSDPKVAAAVEKGQRDGQAYISGSIGPVNSIFRRNWPAFYFSQILGGQVIESETTTTPKATETVIPVGQMIAEYQTSALVARQQLADDVAAVDRHNVGVRRFNDRVTQVLRAVSGEDRGVGRDGWKSWYVNLKGYTYYAAPEQPRPTLVEEVPLAYEPQMVPVAQYVRNMGPSMVTTNVTAYATSKIASCFGAGTLVRTFDGSLPIESLRVGDRVLTQSTATGALGYRPVVAVHHNPPSPTFLIQVAGDTIVSSPFHRFWKAGQGWVMARDIRAGDRLRLLDGVAKVSAVEDGKIQPVFNLDVAGDADFFAGHAAALVHDNTLPDPRLAPFDATPPAAVVSSRGE